MKPYILLFLAIANFSCKKFVEPGNPRTQLTTTTVFSSDATAIAAMLAIYSQLEGTGFAHSTIANPGVSADELRNHSVLPESLELAANNINPTNIITYNAWTGFYRYIYQCNAILEQLEKSTLLTAAVKSQLKGEALFTRAYCNFYLVQLFGKVPLLTTTDYLLNSLAAREETNVIYEAITNDLVNAGQLMDENYRSATNGNSTERIRPNKAAASALLARVYLHRNMWAEAEAASTDVISRASLYQVETNLNNAFLRTSKEAIWQLMAVVPRYNSYTGAVMILTTTPTQVSIHASFLTSFAAADLRRSSWIQSLAVGANIFYYPTKYKVGQTGAAITEYSTLLRLAEQFLIRSEARLQQDNLAGAESDLNRIRSRAGLATISGLSKPNLADSIVMERKRELFCEFGDRWLTLKRTGRADAVMSAFKGSSWNTADQLYPIPQTELIRNPNLTQNPGY